eukprot:TRINITY_DN1247_c0_g1_i1.p1 TRINITY_DN1247_c0_g1~~TRINITY_DN1247_c0_g1_i1.p1  ORF type:complete len:809 (-),score=252.81 TRINITY_DN1247_c0_g1_i1:192-2618(-)
MNTQPPVRPHPRGAPRPRGPMVRGLQPRGSSSGPRPRPMSRGPGQGPRGPRGGPRPMHFPRGVRGAPQQVPTPPGTVSPPKLNHQDSNNSTASNRPSDEIVFDATLFLNMERDYVNKLTERNSMLMQNRGNRVFGPCVLDHANFNENIDVSPIPYTKLPKEKNLCFNILDALLNHKLDKLRVIVDKPTTIMKPKGVPHVVRAPAPVPRMPMGPKPSNPLGLRNDPGENNCFLNVVVQVLYNLPDFRENFLKNVKENHKCKVMSQQKIGQCVCCSLADVMIGLRRCETGESNSLTSVTSLRKALHRNSKKKLFAPGEMNDAAETYMELMELLHDSFVVDDSVVDKDGRCPCFIHEYFGMSVRNKAVCDGCRKVRADNAFSEWSFAVNVNILAENRRRNPGFGYEKNIRRTQEQVDSAYCPTCKSHTEVKKYLQSEELTTFTLAPLWQSNMTNTDEVTRATQSFTHELDLEALYTWMDISRPDKLHGVLKGLFCHYGRHYVAFFVGETKGKEEKWFIADDVKVNPVGNWQAVKKWMVTSTYQPLLMFYQAVERKAVTKKTEKLNYASAATASNPEIKYDSHSNKWIGETSQFSDNIRMYSKSKPQNMIARHPMMKDLGCFTEGASKLMISKSDSPYVKRLAAVIGADYFDIQNLSIDESFVKIFLGGITNDGAGLKNFLKMIADEKFISDISSQSDPSRFLHMHLTRKRRDGPFTVEAILQMNGFRRRHGLGSPKTKLISSFMQRISQVKAICPQLVIDGIVTSTLMKKIDGGFNLEPFFKELGGEDMADDLASASSKPVVFIMDALNRC